MGRVVVPVRVENLRDLFAAEQGTIPGDQVRAAHIADALVDTGATGLSLPKRLISGWWATTTSRSRFITRRPGRRGVIVRP